VLEILAFVKRNYTTKDLNRRQLQSPTGNVCGKYCCLFALYLDRGYIPQNLWRSSTHRQTGRWRRFSQPNSGLKCLVAVGVNAAAAVYKSEYFGWFLSFLIYYGCE